MPRTSRFEILSPKTSVKKSKSTSKQNSRNKSWTAQFENTSLKEHKSKFKSHLDRLLVSNSSLSLGEFKALLESCGQCGNINQLNKVQQNISEMFNSHPPKDYQQVIDTIVTQNSKLELLPSGPYTQA